MEAASLEGLIETEDLGIRILHPGGSQITRELAALTSVGSGTRVLEVAAGTGVTARLLAAEFGAYVTAVDRSVRMIERQLHNLPPNTHGVRIVRADAHQLPFRPGSFEVAMSECAVCHLDKVASIREMARAVRPGGRVGIHDLCWKEGAPEALKRRLREIEHEEPETVAGWVRVFESAGLRDVKAYDRSSLIPDWTKKVRGAIGLPGYLNVVARVLRRWGIRGLRTVLEAERIFSSPHLGYVLVLGSKS